MKRAALVVVVVGMIAAGWSSYRFGLFDHLTSQGMHAAAAPQASGGQPPPEATPPASQSPAAVAVSPMSSPSATTPADATAPLQSPASAAPPVRPQPGAATTDQPGVSIAAAEMGGHIESSTSETSDFPARRLIDGLPGSRWSAANPAKFPQELVFSFYQRQPALVSSVVIVLDPSTPWRWPKDVEVWTSSETATTGFVKVAGLTLTNQAPEQSIQFAPVEARYVKLRILSGGDTLEIGEVQIREASRAGYTPLVVRNPDLAALLALGATPASASTSVITAPLDASFTSCTAAPPPIGQPAHGESREVLVIGNPKGKLGTDGDYPPLAYSSSKAASDASIYRRMTFTRIEPEDATISALTKPDTVVLSQLCAVKTRVSTRFKNALMGWVAQGHKLIIQDSDLCGVHEVPDYSFLPYRFATSNPGATGSPSDTLLFVEENGLGNGKPNDPAFLDIPAWLANTGGNNNELGDSNTIVAWDPRWCGHLFGTNVLKKNGFAEAYTHYGRGLIIYDGFDIDQHASPAYRQLLTRELAQPFDPDNLACTAHLSDFILTTEERLKRQPMVPGRSYTYPLTLLSNQGYKGTIALTLGGSPSDASVQYQFDPARVDLSEIAKTRLTVTTQSASSRGTHMLAVRGTDTAGKSNMLCLALDERTTGGLQVLSALAKGKKPTRNLEIVLDLSGSMKLRLASSTRVGTARQVLRTVLGRIPDDFSVGLRLYGHRYASTSKETCTDSELVVPIQKLDRARILAKVEAANPRGETPLVYSVLQTIGDLKGAGGGSVILITDGEESCHGDPVAAARTLKESGIDLTLNIVGFTLTGQQVQRDLSNLAQSTGGRYYSAQDGDTLARVLLMATVDKLPFTVVDSTGATVARGEAGESAQELPPGDYKVVVQAGDQQIVAEHVKVTQNGDVVLTVVAKGDRFVIER